MHAAVVTAFGTPPRWQEFPAPIPGDDEILVDVVAAGLHQRVRSDADGTHYTSDGVLPMIPGIDGVGRTAAGELLYFVAHDTPLGTMAERAAVDRRRAIALPAGTDPVAVAAAMNPAMSSWIALRRRANLRPGASVLVLGATGGSGQLAVQVARHLGASRVIGAGRDPERLALVRELGADAVFDLTDPALVEAAADVDVVLDYLWGKPAEQLLPALLTARPDRAEPLTWVEIGSVAGPEITLPSFLLRAAAVSIVGSGQGSVRTRDILAELPELARLITDGTFRIDVLGVPMPRVTEAWTAPAAPGQRIVLTLGE
ncbi:zinc-binding alcohol dehydrogenase family protein [Actinoplanes sp. L3-i22]|uniref:quinone oxidoreductase family protein n=1 Tax=Actinoplanes sp. L3-i22 TaxID=2836373 RepID=UPI001C773FB1|nr:zinc-binding alcohol dehydrogenase family protein [Actinoplanes sp. L3-i22]BCY10463.1 NADPH:quinone reductase [Actinoplanes sp. L3-i22]